ncbi:MAG: redox-sensing transcriptional repressor Rex [Bacilli bacterium]
MDIKNVSNKQLERYPLYLKYLLSLDESHIENVSSPMIARALELTEEQVRKDLQIVTKKEGKPREGRKVKELIEDLEQFLGYNEISEAVIVGVGHLGQAFMKYKGFSSFGLRIVAGFDIDPRLVGTNIKDKPIYDVSKIKEIVPHLNCQIAIVTTPSDVSQEIVNILVESGIEAIWNFTPIHLDVPKDVVVENVNLASSLAVLSHKLKRKNMKEI